MKTRGGATTTIWKGRPVTVLQVQWQFDDSMTLSAQPVIVGRAIVDTAEGGRYHAIVIAWDEVSRDVASRTGREVKAQKHGAMFWDRETNAFVVVEI